MAFDIVLLAIVVFFLFVRLKNQFGKVDETDEERKQIIEKFKQQSNSCCQAKEKAKTGIKILNLDNFKREKNDKNIVEVASNKEKDSSVVADKKTALESTLDEIFEKSDIDKNYFLHGAELAFEMIVDSISKKDFETLKSLLSINIFEEFKNQIEAMSKKGKNMNATVIKIPNKKILSAKIKDKLAYIDVLFESEQVIFVSNNKGELISGSKKDIENIEEIWTFKKDLSDKNPNWVVVGTRAK